MLSCPGKEHSIRCFRALQNSELTKNLPDGFSGWEGIFFELIFKPRTKIKILLMYSLVGIAQSTVPELKLALPVVCGGWEGGGHI